MAGIALDQISGVNGVDQDLLILRFPEWSYRDDNILYRLVEGWTGSPGLRTLATGLT